MPIRVFHDDDLDRVGDADLVASLEDRVPDGYVVKDADLEALRAAVRG